MVVSIIGLGYIGLPTAAILSSEGIDVVGVDNNKYVVDLINNGQVHIIEPLLAEMVQKEINNGLSVFHSPQKADIFILAVPTPFKKNRKPDLSYIKRAIKDIAPLIQKGNMIILESTVPVGTTEKLNDWLRIERPDLIFPTNRNDTKSPDINIAHCPERVMPGNVINELVNNDRIIGGISDECGERAKIFYKIFVEGECIVTDSRTAELCKLAENSYRDVNIAFANELSLISDSLDINVWELIKLANRHPRVDILQPGPGVGGHCIAVDPWFIVDSAPNESKLIHQARLVNDSKPELIYKKINPAVNKLKKEKKELVISSMGLSFKSNIDDLRQSPAMEIAKKIELMGFKKCYVCEPNIEILPDSFNSKKTKLINIDSRLFTSDIIVLLVDHMEVLNINLSQLDGAEIIDTRGIWSKK